MLERWYHLKLLSVYKLKSAALSCHCFVHLCLLVRIGLCFFSDREEVRSGKSVKRGKQTGTIFLSMKQKWVGFYPIFPKDRKSDIFYVWIIESQIGYMGRQISSHLPVTYPTMQLTHISWQCLEEGEEVDCGELGKSHEKNGKFCLFHIQEKNLNKK